MTIHGRLSLLPSTQMPVSMGQPNVAFMVASSTDRTRTSTEGTLNRFRDGSFLSHFPDAASATRDAGLWVAPGVGR